MSDYACKKESFVKFVSTVLLLNRAANVTTCSLTKSRDFDSSHADEWMNDLAMCLFFWNHVIDLVASSSPQVPSMPFMIDSLCALELYAVHVWYAPSVVQFCIPNLKTLLLQNAELSFKGNDAPLLAKANIVLSVSLSLELLGGLSKRSTLQLAYGNGPRGFDYGNLLQFDKSTWLKFVWSSEINVTQFDTDFLYCASILKALSMSVGMSLTVSMSRQLKDTGCFE
ncbi:hypothetical protein Cgig2_013273 [Carnegiea gigantea]|uniref:Uncharacterized protein n=1 Tax=Carnegiea gigantea TaxID=171969 RepID=A0A9Q1K2F4_9CARY|nr:hypothetical protein Cgig2_013273 [Carnegiea gigantea]